VNVIEQVFESYLDAQIKDPESLEPDSSIEDVATAFARRMRRARAAGGRDLAVMRTVARVGVDPGEGCERLVGKFDRSCPGRGAGDRGGAPRNRRAEFIFRIRSVAGHSAGERRRLDLALTRP
jgi:hypothetical protein